MVLDRKIVWFKVVHDSILWKSEPGYFGVHTVHGLCMNFRILGLDDHFELCSFGRPWDVTSNSCLFPTPIQALNDSDYQKIDLRLGSQGGFAPGEVREIFPSFFNRSRISSPCSLRSTDWFVALVTRRDRSLKSISGGKITHLSLPEYNASSRGDTTCFYTLIAFCQIKRKPAGYIVLLHF